MVNKQAFQKAKDIFPFMNGFTLEEEKTFLNYMTLSQIKKGKILMEEGFNCLNIFFILKGLIRVYKLSEDGREVTLYRMSAGETCLITASCIMTSVEFNAIAQVEKKVEIVSIPAKFFRQLLSQNNEFQTFIFEKTFERLQDVMSVVENITFENIDKRVARLLYSLITTEDSSHILKITHEEIALEI